MADVESGFDTFNNNKELEDGEIDDLEEGEITDNEPGFSGYRYSGREERSSTENERQEMWKLETQLKSQRPTHVTYDRNVVRQPNYSHRYGGQWMGPSLTRNYGSIDAERGSFNDNVDLSRPEKFRNFPDPSRKFRPPSGQFRRPLYQSCILFKLKRLGSDMSEVS